MNELKVFEDPFLDKKLILPKGAIAAKSFPKQQAHAIATEKGLKTAAVKLILKNGSFRTAIATFSENGTEFFAAKKGEKVKIKESDLEGAKVLARLENITSNGKVIASETVNRVIFL